MNGALMYEPDPIANWILAIQHLFDALHPNPDGCQWRCSALATPNRNSRIGKMEPPKFKNSQ